MIKLCHDNILVKEIVKDSNAGVLRVMQDESSAYMFFEILEMSFGAAYDLDLIEYDEEEQDNKVKDLSNYVLVTQRIAKIPFVNNTYFIYCAPVNSLIPTGAFS